MIRVTFLPAPVLRMVAVALIALVGTAQAATIAAQETATAEVVAEVVTEQPTNPPPPTVGPPPTSIPTNTPQPTVAPTPTVEPTSPPTLSATTAPTETVAATETPEPVISYNLNPDASCTSEPATRSTPFTADCEVQASIHAEHASGKQLGFVMTVSSPATPSGWSVRLRSASSAWQNAPLTAGWTDLIQEDGAIHLGERLPFQVEATPSCTATSTSLTLSISLDVSLDGQKIASPNSTVAHQLTLVAPATPEPSLSFVGALDFGEITPSSNGTAVEADGTIVLEIADLAASCGTWDVTVSGGSLSSDTGDVIPGGNLQLVAVNGTPLPGGPCSVTESCFVTTVASGSASATPTSVTLEFLLTVPADTSSGIFLSGISADARPS